MDDEFEKPEPKISLVVGIFGLLICIVLDALSFIPFVADIEEAPAILVLILSAVFGLGGPIIAIQVVTDILKAIPGVQELPLWTPTWLFVWWLENSNSKVAQLGQQAIDTAAVAEGDIEELGEESAAIEEETAAAAANVQESTEITADRQMMTGEEPSAAQQSSTESEEAESEGKNQDKRNDIELGSEVSPDEEAANQDFGAPEASYGSNDEGDEDEDEDDFQQAA
jgi:FtsZ-binding cell division protein ZapB